MRVEYEASGSAKELRESQISKFCLKLFACTLFFGCFGFFRRLYWAADEYFGKVSANNWPLNSS